jgi:hypothetical protein
LEGKTLFPAAVSVNWGAKQNPIRCCVQAVKPKFQKSPLRPFFRKACKRRDRNAFPLRLCAFARIKKKKGDGAQSCKAAKAVRLSAAAE